MDPVIDTTLAAALAVLLLSASAHKVRALGRFRATLADYRILPAALVPAGAVLVAGAEVATALALAASWTRPLGFAATAVLFAAYGGAIAVNLRRGRTEIDCGCAGPAVRRPISGWLVARNALLVTVALAGLLPAEARVLTWIDACTVIAATAALGALWAALDHMIAQVPAVARLRGAA